MSFPFVSSFIQKSILFFYHACPWHRTQAVRLGKQVLLPTEPSCQPKAAPFDNRNMTPSCLGWGQGSGSLLEPEGVL